MNEIKMDVQKMVKRRKDSGFTLIELMIVIAVIGILAVVLVPKVGGVKTAAKTSGLDVNIRTVQAYAESQISKWSEKGSDQATVDTDVAKAMTAATYTIGGSTVSATASNPLVNPIDGQKATAYKPGGSSSDPGSVYVDVTGIGTGSTYNVTIGGVDNNGNVYKTVVVQP